VWVGHRRKGDAHLAQLLDKGRGLCHPFVIGELACDNLKKRSEILNALNEHACTPAIEPDEYVMCDHKLAASTLCQALFNFSAATAGVESHPSSLGGNNADSSNLT